MKLKFNINTVIIILGSIVLICIAVFLLQFNRSIDIAGNVMGFKPETSTGNVSKITGEDGTDCRTIHRRPVAVMLSSDPVARPLAGISQADIAFEMPVTPGGVTRIMTVFKCLEPAEIGSVRSAREDFVPLAAGLKAIYAHWGGEHDVLEELKSGIINNINGLVYDGTVYYRKKSLPAPHNGFTTLAKLLDKSEELKYDLTDTFEGYPHTNQAPARSLSNIAENIQVSFVSPYDVVWQYDGTDHNYSRFRNGKPEIDSTNNLTVKARVIIIMETEASVKSVDYNNVRVTGRGRATIYQDGVSVVANWEKGPGLSDKLKFLDSDGKEIPFMPGKIWVEIVTNGPSIQASPEYPTQIYNE